MGVRCLSLSAAFRKSSGLGGKAERDEPEGLDRPLGDQYHGDDALRLEIQPTGKQVFVKTVPPSTKRVDLEEVSTSSNANLYSNDG